MAGVLAGCDSDDDSDENVSPPDGAAPGPEDKATFQSPLVDEGLEITLTLDEEVSGLDADDFEFSLRGMALADADLVVTARVPNDTTTITLSETTSRDLASGTVLVIRVTHEDLVANEVSYQLILKEDAELDGDRPNLPVVLSTIDTKSPELLGVVGYASRVLTLRFDEGLQETLAVSAFTVSDSNGEDIDVTQVHVGTLDLGGRPPETTDDDDDEEPPKPYVFLTLAENDETEATAFSVLIAPDSVLDPTGNAFDPPPALRPSAASAMATIPGKAEGGATFSILATEELEELDADDFILATTIEANGRVTTSSLFEIGEVSLAETDGGEFYVVVTIWDSDGMENLETTTDSDGMETTSKVEEPLILYTSSAFDVTDTNGKDLTLSDNGVALTGAATSPPDTRAPTLSFEADTTVTTTVAIEPAGGSGTGLGGVVFSVTASEALENVSADDFVLSGTAYAVVNARFVSEPAASSDDDDAFYVVLTVADQDGRTATPSAAVALVLGLAPGVDATDASGNTLTLAASLTLATAATSQDTRAPFLLDVNLGKAALSAEGRVFEIEASETLMGVDAADFVLASGLDDSNGMLVTATDFGLAGVTTTIRDRDGEDVFYILVTVTLVDATATLSDESLRLGASTTFTITDLNGNALTLPEGGFRLVDEVSKDVESPMHTFTALDEVVVGPGGYAFSIGLSEKVLGVDIGDFVLTQARASGNNSPTASTLYEIQEAKVVETAMGNANPYELVVSVVDQDGATNAPDTPVPLFLAQSSTYDLEDEAGLALTLGTVELAAMVRSDFTAPTATPVTPTTVSVIEAEATRIVFTLDLSEELLDVVPADFEFQGDEADDLAEAFEITRTVVVNTAAANADPEWKLLIELGAVQSVTDGKSYTLVETETLTFGTVPGRQVTDAGRNQLVLSEVVLGTAKITTDVDNGSPAALSLSASSMNVTIVGAESITITLLTDEILDEDSIQEQDFELTGDEDEAYDIESVGYQLPSVPSVGRSESDDGGVILVLAASGDTRDAGEDVTASDLIISIRSSRSVTDLSGNARTSIDTSANSFSIQYQAPPNLKAEDSPVGVTLQLPDDSNESGGGSGFVVTLTASEAFEASSLDEDDFALFVGSTRAGDYEITAAMQGASTTEILVTLDATQETKDNDDEIIGMRLTLTLAEDSDFHAQGSPSEQFEFLDDGYQVTLAYGQDNDASLEGRMLEGMALSASDETDKIVDRTTVSDGRFLTVTLAFEDPVELGTAILNQAAYDTALEAAEAALELREGSSSRESSNFVIQEATFLNGATPITEGIDPGQLSGPTGMRADFDHVVLVIGSQRSSGAASAFVDLRLVPESNGFTEAEDDDDSIAFETLTIAENIQADGTSNQVRLAEAGFLVNGSANSDENDLQLDRYVDGASDENLLEVTLTFDEAVELGNVADSASATTALEAARAVFELRDGATAGTSSATTDLEIAAATFRLAGTPVSDNDNGSLTDDDELLGTAGAMRGDFDEVILTIGSARGENEADIDVDNVYIAAAMESGGMLNFAKRDDGGALSPTLLFETLELAEDVEADGADLVAEDVTRTDSSDATLDLASATNPNLLTVTLTFDEDLGPVELGSAVTNSASHNTALLAAGAIFELRAVTPGADRPETDNSDTTTDFAIESATFTRLESGTATPLDEGITAGDLAGMAGDDRADFDQIVLVVESARMSGAGVSSAVDLYLGVTATDAFVDAQGNTSPALTALDDGLWLLGTSLQAEP